MGQDPPSDVAQHVALLELPKEMKEKDAAARMRKIVVTGGPGSGKSSIIDVLERWGCKAVHEAAIQCINELSNELGVEAQKKWRLEHKDQFQMMVTRRQKELEDAVDPNLPMVFFDRGRLDGHGYAKF